MHNREQEEVDERRQSNSDASLQACHLHAENPITLFKQYLETCEVVGFQCALDSSMDIENLETKDKPPKLERHAAFVAHKNDRSSTRRLSSVCANQKETVHIDMSWSCRSAARASSAPCDFFSVWKAAMASPKIPDTTDSGVVYKSQLAAALTAGRTVWL